MNKKANEMLWGATLQILFAAMIVIILYLFAGGILDNNTFREEVYASDIALSGSVIASSAKGVMEFASVLGVTNTKAELKGNTLSILTDNKGASNAPLITKKDIIVQDASFKSRALIWRRNLNIISIFPYDAANTCPLTVNKIVWNKVAVTGSSTYMREIKSALESMQGVLTQPLPAGADITIILSDGDFEITVPDDDLGKRISCLTKEIFASQKALAKVLTKVHSGSDILIQIPANQDRLMIKNLFTKLFSEAVNGS